MRVDDRLNFILAGIRVQPFRIQIETQRPVPGLTISMIRGVWGAALHALDRDTYERVFEGRGDGVDKTPAYVIRPGRGGSATSFTIEWILFRHALKSINLLCEAWNRAGVMGLGKARIPFQINSCIPLDEMGAERSSDQGWLLGSSRWLLSKNSIAEPCRLVTRTPLRTLRRQPGNRQSELIETPTLRDFVVAGFRRVAALSERSDSRLISGLQPTFLQHAEQLGAEVWWGERVDLSRYSGRQEKEIVTRGVMGFLPLPNGVGILSPLLSAICWIHVGKGTTLGLGQVDVES